MIRINLLPGVKREARATGGGTQLWVAAYIVCSLLLIAVLAFIYLGLDTRLREERAQNSAIQRDIRRLQEQSANIDEVRAELDDSRALETVVAELQRARYGPVEVLMELTRVLSQDGRPTIDPRTLEGVRQGDPQAGINPAWDHHRLWVKEMSETEREATIVGVGRSNDDVAEFLRRLTLSRYFERVVLVRTQGLEDRETGLSLIEFELNARLVY